MITQAELKELLEYDPLTGIFRYKLRAAGKIAGGKSAKGYIFIRLKYIHYAAHKLAWLYVHGYMPERIDHEDRTKDNNAIKNLRECSRGQNRANTSANVGRKLPKGVYERNGRYRSWIKANGVMHHLGTFDVMEDAAIMYRCYATHFFGNFANF